MGRVRQQVHPKPSPRRVCVVSSYKGMVSGSGVARRGRLAPSATRLGLSVDYPTSINRTTAYPSPRVPQRRACAAVFTHSSPLVCCPFDYTKKPVFRTPCPPKFGQSTLYCKCVLLSRRNISDRSRGEPPQTPGRASRPGGVARVRSAAPVAGAVVGDRRRRRRLPSFVVVLPEPVHARRRGAVAPAHAAGSPCRIDLVSAAPTERPTGAAVEAPEASSTTRARAHG
ncbi:hypothetical protein EVAR_95628_1 [Eumeta japonica]|uniref:Uncharacterized protein n=1 Tax=Eumeta variegata TaxID=151549 RepID=A0A4C2ABG0_EUMVA|nr:hypothetical protein EVAR_95628_1 [Eumeta japonica]